MTSRSSGTLVQAAAELLRRGPVHTLDLARAVMGLTGHPGAASAAVFSLLGADSRFSVDGEGTWSLREDGTAVGVDINPDGWYRVWRRRPNFNTETKEYTYRIETIRQKESREIDQGLGTVNRLSLEVADRLILVSCNGNRLTSLNTSMSGDLTIGLTVSTFRRPPTTARFDNLSVTFRTLPSIGS